MPGMHGNYTAVTSMQHADLLIALGSRFDDRVTGKVGEFAPDAKIIHADIDPAELGKVRRPDVPIVGDCRLVIQELVQRSAIWAAARPNPTGNRGSPSSAAGRRSTRCTTSSRTTAARSSRSSLSSSSARHVARGHDRRVRCGPAPDVDQPVLALHRALHLGQLRGLGHHGLTAVPAAIGAKVGRPDRTVWAVDGDGCFQMTAQELVTAAAEGIPVKVAILNNAYLGMVRQWQEMFYEERYSEVYLTPDLPDYVRWAEALGCIGLRPRPPRTFDR